MYEIGVSKKDITCFKKGVGMFGYGMHFHRVQGLETRLKARAFFIKDSDGNRIVYVCAEILTCTISVKKGVVKKLQRSHPDLGLDFDNILITGTHTHSGPGGYTHYGLYNIPVPGFVPEVYATIVDGVCETIVEAAKGMRPATIRIGMGEFSPDVPVAFNRSLNAYNKNPDTRPIAKEDRHLAVDRTMTLMRFDDANGEPIGSINWFGVHTTSCGNDLMKICADNKGYAADYFEEDVIASSGNENFVAAFSQAPCGDVSPNFVWDPKRNRMRGASSDDYENAKVNGRYQYEKAKEIFESACKEITGPIDFGAINVDFSNIPIDPEFTGGIPGRRTGHACLGVSFFEGTTDGMGISKALGFISRRMLNGLWLWESVRTLFGNEVEKERIRIKYSTQGKKHVLIESGERRVLGSHYVDRVLGPAEGVDYTVKHFIKQYKSGSLGDKPWTPVVLPLQLIILGNVAIAAVPTEPTTVAGRRMRDSLLEVLGERGVNQVMISAYSNGYAGYVTTKEEYAVQRYEGGHTMYGEWTLGGYQTKFKALALELLKKPEERSIDRSIQPAEFSEEELAKRTYRDEDALAV